MAYTGSVANLTGVGVAGVVVEMSTRPSYPADLRTTLTDAKGRWSLMLNGCPHDTRFYWASAAEGPLLYRPANVSLSQSSSVRVDVSWQPVNLTWVQEYPNDRNVSIRFTFNGSLLAEAKANVSGQPATSFLAHTSSGAPGSSALLQGNFTFSRGTPYSVVWIAGTAYRVVDVNGSVVTYLALGPESDLRLSGTQEYMSMAGAIDADRTDGIYPFKSVAPSGYETISRPFQWSSGDATVNVTVLGATIPVTLTLREPLLETVAVTFVNSSPYDQCYAWFPNTIEEHWWYYGNGTCPPS